jgi:hypothetical protein
MDDDLDPKAKDLEDALPEDEVDDFDDGIILGSKKSKKHDDDDDVLTSLDALADEEDGILPEDSFDDEDLW